MANNAEPGEVIVYSYNKGHKNSQVLVTSRRVVLGMESWPIEAISDVQLTTHKVFAPRQLLMSEGMMKGSSMAGLLVMTGIGLMAFMSISKSYSAILLALAGVLAIAGIAIGAYTAVRNPKEIYKVTLTLTGMSGGQHIYEPMYTWQDLPPTRRTVAAIKQAIADKSNRVAEP